MNPQFMREAIKLSRSKMKANHGGPFGAVIVRNGRIVGRGWNQVTSTNDPTAHAEVVALRAACKKLRRFHLDDCELYTSCEPCPMCLGALYWARIAKIYFANTRKDAARIEFDDALIYREIGLPLARRLIPMRQMMRREALEVFRAWQRKSDRIEY